MDDYKGAYFGGFPGDELDKILAWATAATSVVAELQDRILVLEALVREEHAAANPGAKVDIVSAVIKSVDVRTAHKNVVGGAPVLQLITAINELAKAWGK